MPFSGNSSCKLYIFCHMFQCFTWGGANFFPILSFKFDPSKRWQSSADCKFAPTRFFLLTEYTNLDANAEFFGIDLLFLFWMCLVGDVSRDSTMVNHHLGFFSRHPTSKCLQASHPEKREPNSLQRHSQSQGDDDLGNRRGLHVFCPTVCWYQKWVPPPKTNECPVKVQWLEDVCHFPWGFR